ncbi:cell wall-binding repeat-containing protein [Guptibacillus hwajinpoensis]|uniref:Cell wall-binding protein/peptidoglycan/xylan/chitin deacetylase (PgdA/CDA1 family) n=1 Tax=Guptibacillus hwajinpoensis TaxID=208199 RepID=A0ABU0K1K8_9BACL|nr:cell wall-binding repeat-containing protein [Alkalihalobacillus hemicentroti]MDQ0482575.1 putative cell wall-binding protein/peptidoglycan/xylan/chitin deacetylase (PgdA/CDA1 family) [Alkalihalobacillus hemicentroti]
MKKKHLLIALVVLCLNLVILSANNADAATLQVDRLAGETRLHTAIEIANKGWPDGVDNEEKAVILARADKPADALSAAGLSGVKDAPILLTYPSKLHQDVLDEIMRLGTSKVYVLGGTTAISENVITQLRDAKLDVKRIAGENRFETAVEINREAGLDQNNHAYLVNGVTVADALSASSSAAINQTPIYLATKNTIPAKLPKTIKEITIVGGNAVVSANLEDEFKNNNVIVNRIQGSNRFETNLELIKTTESSSKNILFVRGISSKAETEDYPDAVTAGGLAHRLDATVFLLHPKGSNQDKAVKNYLNQQDYNAYILGGLNAVPDNPLSKIGIEIPDYAEEVPVLTYHHILKKDDLRDSLYYPSGHLNNMVVLLEEFEKQMNLLNEEGYQTITLEEFEAFIKGVKHVPENSVLITFDDGHKNNYIRAYPVLKKHGFTAVEFLVTSRLTEKTVPFDTDLNQFLSWSEIKEGNDVFEYASHTHDYHSREKDTLLPYLISKSKKDIKKDIQKSIELIDSNPIAFAYPYGAYNDTTIQALNELNVDMAFTINKGNAKPGDNTMEIRRQSVRPYHSLKDFEQMIDVN